MDEPSPSSPVLLYFIPSFSASVGIPVAFLQRHKVKFLRQVGIPTVGMPSLLWVDLRFYQSQAGLDRGLVERYRLHNVNETVAIAKAIGQTSPQLLCFEFDYPDLPKLKALQQTHRVHPTLPILMLTEHHSEALAVWAFRAGVWDYLVTPVAVETLSCSIDLALKSERPPTSIPIEVRFSSAPSEKRITLPAVLYIKENYS